MRFGSMDLRGILTGSFDHHYVADLYYNGSRRRADLPIKMPTFKEDAGASIQQAGSCTVKWSDEFATSLLPRYVTDPLAPFGAQLWVYCWVTVGPFAERVEYGRFEITDVPSARDEQMRFRQELITLGSTVELELKELLAGVEQETFDAPSAPLSLGSTWAEVARITGLPLSRTVADKAIPRSIMYPEKKLDAVYDLMDVVLEASPHMTPDGTVSARPHAWGSPVDTLTMDGTLVEVGQMMSAAQVKNRVAVRATSGEQTSVLATAEITSGPLRVRNANGSVSPFRARTEYLSNELIVDEVAARAWANQRLSQVSTLRARILPITEKFNPLRERGDVVVIERPDKNLLGRVVTIERGSRGTQELTVEIAGEA